MFHRIRTYQPIVGANGESFVPRAYAEPNSEGWSGYLAFFPRIGAPVATDFRTTDRTLAGVVGWADSLLVDDLHAALARARVLSRDSVVEAEITRLRFLENEAHLDADVLDERAEVNHEAALEARTTADRLARKRKALEVEGSTLQEEAAEADAKAHETAASEARAAARKARTRRKVPLARNGLWNDVRA